MSTRWTLWDWPFFDPSHRELAARIADWNATQHQRPAGADQAARSATGANAPAAPSAATTAAELTAECVTLARTLGEAGFLRYVVPTPGTPIDVRSICIIREALTYEHALADAIFAMQGIGTMAIQRFGTEAQKDNYLEP